MYVKEFTVVWTTNHLIERRLGDVRVRLGLGLGLGLGSVAQTSVAQAVCCPNIWRPFKATKPIFTDCVSREREAIGIR